MNKVRTSPGLVLRSITVSDRTLASSSGVEVVDLPPPIGCQLGLLSKRAATSLLSCLSSFLGVTKEDWGQARHERQPVILGRDSQTAQDSRLEHREPRQKY